MLFFFSFHFLNLFFQISLMLLKRRIKQTWLFDLRLNLVLVKKLHFIIIISYFLNLRFDIFRNIFLVIVMMKNDRRVLGPFVMDICGVMQSVEELDHFFKVSFAWIEQNMRHFNISGVPFANLLVCWRLFLGMGFVQIHKSYGRP